MLRKGLVVGTICILMLVYTPIALGDINENNVIGDNGKIIVYFRANNLEHFITNNDIINTPIGLIRVFINRVNDFVRFYFQDMTGEMDTEVRILNNGQPQIIHKDVSIEFDLGTKNSFVVFLTTRNSRGFAICDSVSINDI